MRAFNPDQQSIIEAIEGVAVSYTSSVLEALSEVNLRFSALQGLLVKAGVITQEQIEMAISETRAAKMVEIALSPDIQAAQENLRRLLQSEDVEEG